MKNNNQLGCLSLSGVAAVIVTIVLICGSYTIWGGQMFSPGKLNAQPGANPLGGVNSHAGTGRQCSACHVSPISGQTMDDRCLACHTDIAEQLNSSDNLHGSVLAVTSAISCRACHTDHNGPDAPITSVDSVNVSHDLFGFSLRGHQKNALQVPFDCRDCHLDQLTTFESNTCLDCHSEYEPEYILEHIEAFGQTCQECHDGAGTHAQYFDHFNAEFRLKGKHINLECKDCHFGAGNLAEMGSLDTKCIDCHRADDPHEQTFGQECQLCHIENDWAQANFDHSTKISEDCTACHQEDAPTDHYRGQCSDCHNSVTWDETQFDHTVRTVVKCTACHTTDKPANHFAGKCSACHTTTDWENVQFDHSSGNFTNCAECHTSDKPTNHYAGQCSACHTTKSWEGAIYDHTFPINHEGANGQCSRCHNINNAQPYATYTCYNCHEHSVSKVEKKHRKEGIKNFQNCIECHWDGREHDDD